MFFRKRGKKWEYRIELPKNGDKRQQFSKGGFNSKKEAEAAAAKKLTELNIYGTLNDENILFKDFANIFFNFYAQSVKPQTLYNRQRISTNRILPYLGNIKLKDFNTFVIQQYINDAQKVYTNKTLQQAIITLKLILEYAFNNYTYLHSNPMKNVVFKSDEQRRDINIYTPQELEKIKNIKEPLIFLVTQIALNTGMRISEILGLTWDNINLDDSYILVKHNLLYYNLEYHFSTPKSKKSNRKIYFGEELKKVLLKQLITQKENRLKYGKKYSSLFLKNEIINELEGDILNLVITKENGLPVNYYELTKRISKVNSELGINITMHKFRHTLATKLIENGINIKYVSELLGHASVSITYDTYVKTSQKSKLATKDAIVNLIYG